MDVHVGYDLLATAEAEMAKMVDTAETGHLASEDIMEAMQTNTMTLLEVETVEEAESEFSILL